MRFSLPTGVLLAFVIVTQSYPAEESNKKPQTQTVPVQQTRRLAECKNLLPIFKALGLPTTKGKHWVQVDVGWNLNGWLIDDSPKSLTLLDEYGSTRHISRAAKKPTRRETAGRPVDLDEELVVKGLHDADFAEFCRKFVKKGLPNVDREKEEDGIQYLDGGGRGRIADHAIAACRYAYWALEQGNEELASQLYATAEDALSFWNKRFIQQDSSLIHFVIEREIKSLRTGAVLDAHYHHSRSELLDKWRLISQIPNSELTDEAKRMVQYYENLIAEDRQWNEPSKDRLEKMTPDEKAAYWMYHLRDADAGQMSQPGQVAVLGLGGYGNKEPHAAIELEKLGWEAIPVLIEHLDDRQPTRCQGHWRDFGPESYHLLAYGDVCQQVFESITLHTIYEGSDYPVRDGKVKECKAAAKRWYDEMLKKGGRKAWEEERAKQLRENPFAGLRHRM